MIVPWTTAEAFKDLLYRKLNSQRPNTGWYISRPKRTFASRVGDVECDWCFEVSSDNGFNWQQQATVYILQAGALALSTNLQWRGSLSNPDIANELATAIIDTVIE